MSRYRILLLTKDGLIARPSVFFARASDEEAVERARQIADPDGLDFEIWDNFCIIVRGETTAQQFGRPRSKGTFGRILAVYGPILSSGRTRLEYGARWGWGPPKPPSGLMTPARARSQRSYYG